MARNLKIVFFGTSTFGIPALGELATVGHHICRVVTPPDKQAGRGLKMKACPVKEFALNQGWPVLQPSSLRDPEFLRTLKGLHPDVFVVIAFRKLPPEILEIPALGAINLHGSLLPQYRGAAPINWAIMHGQKKTGVTSFYLDPQLDTGNIIDQLETDISDQDNASSLTEKLSTMSANLAKGTLDRIARGDRKSTPQRVFSDLQRAPKILKEFCKIDWSQTSESVHNFIRGLTYFPGAWTLLHGHKIHVYGGEPIDPPVPLAEGEFHKEGGSGLLVGTGGAGCYRILELKLQGRKAMDTRTFLNGYRWKEGGEVG